MGDFLVKWRWHRYRRSLRTVPLIVAVAVVVWFLNGRHGIWPLWVILGGGVVIGLRAARALAGPHPDELPPGPARRTL